MVTHNKLHQVKSDLHRASEQIMDAAEEAKINVQEYSHEAVRFIKRSPIKSVLMATAFGLLVGKFFL